MTWAVERLADVCELRPPKAEARQRLKPNDKVSFVPMNDLPESAIFLESKETRTLSEVEGSYTYFSDGDVLLAKITPCFENGKLGVARGLTNGVGFGSSEYFVIRPSSRLLPQFLYYFFARKSFREEGANVMTGAVGHRRVPKQFIENYPVPVPPIDEQKRIVEILDEAFEGIAKARVNTEKNLANSQELFLSELAVTFGCYTKDELVVIADACEAIVDCLNRTAPKVERETPYLMIRTTNVRDGKISLDNVKYVDEDTYKVWTRRQVPKAGDILLTREAPLGEVGLLKSSKKVFLGQRIVSYRADRAKLMPEYLLYCLRSDLLQRQIRGYGSGATVQHMRVPESKALKIPLPELSVQNSIVQKLDKLDELCGRLATDYRRKLSKLEELNHTLLSKAFSGELTTSSKPKLSVESSQNVITSSPEYAAHILAFVYSRHASKRRDKTFGRVKAQKALYTIESIGGVDLGRSPIKDAAGPNDSAHMRQAENWAKQKNYFEFQQRRSGGYDFKKGKEFDKLLAGAHSKLACHKPAIEKVVDLLLPMDSEEAEIFATVHAAWNNLLADGKDINDNGVVNEARENWHESKLKIPKDKFKKAIRFIRSNGLEPDGTAKPVRGQESLF